MRVRISILTFEKHNSFLEYDYDNGDMNVADGEN